jgi:hypothetical protein
MIPGAPDVWTISHILISFAEMVNEFAAPGRILPTHRNPLGVRVAVRVVPLIADLQAVRKVAGYMAFNATQFCNWCLLKLNDIEDLNHTSWTLRDSHTVAAQATAWLKAKTVTKKVALAKKFGVRRTPMHDVVGWNPVHHIILGFMHNWLEGILMRHLRMLWGIGRPKKKMADVKNLGNLDDIGEPSASEMSEMSDSASESEDLAPARGPQYRPQQMQGPEPFKSMDVDSDNESDDSTTPTPETFLGIPKDDEDDEEQEDDLEFDAPGMFNFSSQDLGRIRACIKNVRLPTWVARPPTNLGEAKHGKLKAHEYLILFTVIFPLIIPELWWKKGSFEKALLLNFHHLVACTNIISSFSTSNAQADQFTANYVNYRAGLPQLFTRPQFHSVPNHHFAMHNEQLLKFWGPLAGLSEFAGERMNGMLGRVKHNRRIGL